MKPRTQFMLHSSTEISVRIGCSPVNIYFWLSHRIACEQHRVTQLLLWQRYHHIHVIRPRVEKIPLPKFIWRWFEVCLRVFISTFPYELTNKQINMPTLKNDELIFTRPARGSMWLIYIYIYIYIYIWLQMGCHPVAVIINPLTPNDDYSGRTAPLTSKRCILYIYSTKYRYWIF